MSAQTIGNYDLEGLLGEGGIGQVYAAQDRVLGRQVAIKTLRPELSRDRNFIERFYNEAKSLANLNHTNITTLYSLHAEGEQAYMVMELVRGWTLEALLARVGRLGLREALAVLAQAVPGLRYAHRRGVVHRDIKPANMMITDEGVLKIMDFGIARVRGSQHLTQVGEFCGTFVYASPEQIRGEEVDERSDLYSLAIVFYRLLAGNPPFQSTNEYALMTAQLQEPPPALVGRVAELDAATEAVVMRALAKRSEDRFASVEEFGRAVGAMALRGEAVDILQQLCARTFAEDDGEKTRIFAVHRPATADQTMPSSRPAWRLDEAGPLPGLAAPFPAATAVEPRPSGAARGLAVPASPAVAATPAPGRDAHTGWRRPWLIGGGCGALALLLLGGGYYLTADGIVPNPLRFAAVAPPAPAPAPEPVQPVVAPVPPPAPASTPAPKPVEPVVAPAPPAPAAELKPVEPVVAPAPKPVEPAVAPTPSPPAPEPKPPIEPAVVPAPAPAPAPVEPAVAPVPTPVPTPVEPSVAHVPAPAPAEPAVKPAPEPAVAPAAPPSPPAPAPVEPTPAPKPTPAAVEPSAPAASMPTPEGPPDLEGRVTGARGLNEIELDKTHWISLYGIVDRTPHASQHIQALMGYLKPSRNHLVCYRKAGDTYRCYSDGQDIARQALLDRLVRLAPNAPAEYRALLSQRR